jgi:hypothetical protein
MKGETGASSVEDIPALRVGQGCRSFRCPVCCYLAGVYPFALVAHSWLRWAVVVAGLVLLVSATHCRVRAVPRNDRIDRLRVAFLRLLDLQVVLGLALYLILSPLPRLALADPEAAMGDAVLRFYAVEHAFGMVVGVIVAHVGLDGVPRLGPHERVRRIVATTLLWAVVTLASIPWPFLAYGRPLLRF